MKYLLLLIFSLDLVILQRLSNYPNWTQSQIRIFLAKHDIYSDVVKKCAKNLHILEVAYGFHEMKVIPGGRHTPRQIEQKPTKVKWNAIEDVYYTLMLLGPDCPTIKSHDFRSWLHWSVVNILGGDMRTGEEITPYEGIGASYRPGIHRLVFLLYRQPGIEKINFNETLISSSNRSQFKPMEFAWAHRFWHPIAVNFFYLKNL